jgi:hypothetical protein
MYDTGVGGEVVYDLPFPRAERTVLDTKHTFYSKSKILEVLSKIPVEKYIADIHDCDDFAQDAVYVVKHALAGAPIGFAIGKQPTGEEHAVVVFMVQETVLSNGAYIPGIKRYYYDPISRKMLPGFNVGTVIL